MKKLLYKLKIKSLKWQLLFGFIVILVILVGSMGIFEYISMKEYLYTTKTEVLQQKFHNLDFKNLSKDDITDVNQINFKEISKKLVDKHMSMAVIDKNGEILLTSINTDNITKEDHDGDDDTKDFYEKNIRTIPVPKFSKESYMSICKIRGNLEHTYKVIRDEDGSCQLVVWRKVGNLDSPSGLIQLSTPIDDTEDIIKREVYVHTSLSILILVIGIILASAIFKRTLKPLYDITNTVEGISVTDLDKRLPDKNGQLEIDRLANSFNIMLKRIESSFQKEQYIKEKMRRFVSDASHELKTPLTSIHGFVEILLRGAAKNEEQLNLALNSILTESERLTKLVNDLLVLTRLEQKPVIEMNKENINDIIKEILPQLQILSKERVLDLNLRENISVYINKNQIKQVIFNITQNAVLHTDNKNGSIIISTDIEELKNEHFGVLKISDNGTGIPKNHLDKIYDRFFRSDSHRSREQGGYGLGLSIVKSIVDANQGKIHVKSELGVGTTFSVYLKLVE